MLTEIEKTSAPTRQDVFDEFPTRGIWPSLVTDNTVKLTT